jgi:nucleoside-diphosphate-sugar epimerase
MTRILVTGATGFVGRTLCGVLAQSGHVVRAALRSDRLLPDGVSEKSIVGDIGSTTDWQGALRGVEVVIHLAARAHVINDSRFISDPYYETNTRGTERLANAAAQAGIRRFEYLSSVEVNGEETTGQAFSSHDEPQPRDAYGASKWLAESHVMEVAEKTGMEAVIVRPPLVYGPGVRANFLRLLRWADNEWPLPLGAIKNSRSLVSVWNLCDLLVLLLKHPSAPARTWMVSDGEDLSTPELIGRIAIAMGRRARLLPVPEQVLRFFGALIGRKAELARLCGSLTVTIEETRRELGWSPPIKVDDGLARTISWYLTSGRGP